MNKFCGSVGFGQTVDKGNGVWEEVVVERTYRGDVTRRSTKWQGAEQLNDDLNVNHHISIVADPYAYEHFYAIRYVWWMGARWKVTSVEVQRPRLILVIGGVYNGPEPNGSPNDSAGDSGLR